MKLPPQINARNEAIKILKTDKFADNQSNSSLADIVESLGSKEYTIYPSKRNKPGNNDLPSYWLVCRPETASEPFNGTSFGFLNNGPIKIAETLESLSTDDYTHNEIINSELCRWVSRRLTKENYKYFSAFEVKASRQNSDATVNLILPKIMPALVGEIAIALINEHKTHDDVTNSLLDVTGVAKNDKGIAKRLGLSALYYVGKTLKSLPES